MKTKLMMILALALFTPALFAGATLFLKFEGRAVRQTGRILLGIAFILLALKMIGEATEPLRDSALWQWAIGNGEH